MRWEQQEMKMFRERQLKRKRKSNAQGLWLDDAAPA
jgi:hypothetical protein